MSKAELGNGKWDKNYQPSGIGKEEELADEYQRNHEQFYHVDSYPIAVVKELERNAYICGMKQAQTEIAEKAKFSSGMDGFYHGQGYRDGKKDTIEKAAAWLKANWRDYVWTTDNGIPHFGLWENDFRKAMEEE